MKRGLRRSGLVKSCLTPTAPGSVPDGLGVMPRPSALISAMSAETSFERRKNCIATTSVTHVKLKVSGVTRAERHPPAGWHPNKKNCGWIYKEQWRNEKHVKKGPGWHPPGGGLHPSEINTSESDEQKQVVNFLANVNSSSCSLYVVVRPSVCRLSSVCL